MDTAKPDDTKTPELSDIAKYDLLKVSEGIGKVVPTITILLILLGYFNLYHFYNLFGIEINKFVDTTEIIFSFSSIYLEIIASVFAVSFYSLVFIYGKAGFQKIRSRFKRSTVTGAHKKRIQFLVLVLELMFLCVLMIINSRDEEFNFLFITFAIGLAAFLQINILLEMRILQQPKVVISIVVLWFILFMVVRNITTMPTILKERSNCTVVVSKGDSILVQSSDTLRYVGSTRGYFFFFDVKEKAGVVIQAKGFERVSFKREF
jgi:hypothetical protein